MRSNEKISLKKAGSFRVYHSEKEYIVVPMDNPTEHQVPVAFILPKGDADPNEALMREIMAYCDTELDKFHRPVKYCWLEKFPLTKVGKVDYRALEKETEKE